VSQPLPGQSSLNPRAETGGLGDILRHAREQRRLTIVDCADRLRIRAPYLQALEAGQYDALPGLTYCVAFVRAYAEFLDLDGAAMVQRFKSEAAGLTLQTSLTLPSPAPVGRIPGGGPLMVAIVALFAVVGGWVFLADDPRSLEIRIPDLPERFAAMVQPRATPLPAPAAEVVAAPPDIASALPRGNMTPAAPPDAQIVTVPTASLPVLPPSQPPIALPATPAPPVAAPVLTLPPVTPPVPPSAIPAIPAVPVPLSAPLPPVQTATLPTPPSAAASTAEEERTPAPQTIVGGVAVQASNSEEPLRAPPSAIPVPAQQTDGRVFGGQNTDARVIVRSRGESWVQIRDRDNSTVFTRLLSAGDSFLVPNRTGLTLWTGNAGVLDVSVDGAPAPALGAPGAVKKNVSLDADRLRAGTAVSD
jgi:cytoskeleton protein RodZ